ncbi:MAG: DUF4126 domain-containing protein [bacterium]|nr:DUF4126 domain-containing protein [bacterium]
MEVVNVIALTLGVGWASGINLYAAVFMLGALGATDNIVLPPDLQLLQDPLVLSAAGLMYLVEFTADKMPGVDTGWDVIHSFIRIPAGALLAASAVGDVTPALEFSALLVGGTLAAGSHATKAGSRALINTSPEPFSNWTASVAEDLLVFGGLWAALYNPWLFLLGLILFIAAAVWLMPRIWRGLKRVFRFLAKLFGRPQAVAESVDSSTPPAT